MLAENHQIVEAVAVEIARREKPLRRRGIRDALLLLLRPLALVGLVANHQLIWTAEVDDVGPAIAVEVPQRDCRHFLIDRQFLVLEPPVVLHHVDISPADLLLSRRGKFLALHQQINPALAVIDQQQIDQAIVVQVATQQIGRAFRKLEGLNRFEPVILRQGHVFSASDRGDEQWPQQQRQATQSMNTIWHGGVLERLKSQIQNKCPSGTV